ncbi:hypothetical protein GRI38_10635 [Altererythrobacter aurantiacus]|uniref:NERD domain-containing protein n=1 Tax=Parapontixanthobacter aurantiacus TaxID=1463599 RepID=A0A844ZHN2_9SPHN|nr:nuclease-related domain-containing protein [Parapontixanthobacter aurantiacus]MXO86480.1 hypothetical protein [Parapontixanthobacter aurantiacus]
MILKEASAVAADIAELEQLRASASHTHHAAIDKRLVRLRKGATGERSAAHFLNREFGNSESIGLVHDVRIAVGGDVAQIDHLIIHRFQQAAWLLETKSYSGRLSCDEHGDWTMWYGKKPTPVASPVNQARRQAILLRQWLDEAKVTTVRTITPVVLVSPTSSVKRKHLASDAHVVKSDNFGAWWLQQADKIGVVSALSMFGRHLANGMSAQDLTELGQRLSDAYVPAVRDWRKELSIPAKAIAPAAELTPSPAPMPAAFPHTIDTVHGAITIRELPDGRLALRSDTNEELISVVRGACKGKARWNPRFKNWVFDAELFDDIRVAIARKLDA